LICRKKEHYRQRGGGRPRAGSGPEYALLIVTYLFNGFVMNEFPQEIVDFDNKAKKYSFRFTKILQNLPNNWTEKKMIMSVSNNKVSI
jgi:hypothetical protein